MPRASSDRPRRSASPYTGRPAAADARPATARPKRRTGLRGMLSSLIWGAPAQGEEEEAEEETAADGDADAGDPEASGQDTPIQISSDDDESMEEEQTQDNDVPQRYNTRYTAAQKGKGKAAGILRTAGDGKSSTFSSLKSSQTFGDMRSIQREMPDLATSTPATTGTKRQRPDSPDDGNDRESSPAQLNSTLASFFAEKGAASLTAAEKKRVSELLMGTSSNHGPASTANVPTALTPSFSFRVPPSSATKVSVLSPNYSSISRSATTAGLSKQAGLKGGLTGSQSLSSLSSLLSGDDSSRLPASANPRSAVNRRAAARPLYLGAGYSSSAVARRKKAAQQAQMKNLYGDLATFSGSTASSGDETIIGTPGKRRRVGEEANTSTTLTVGASGASPVSSIRPSASTLSSPHQPSAQPSSSVPAPAFTSQIQQSKVVPSSLFSSAPHLKAKFGLSTPVRPSPLRQAAAAATPSPPVTPAGLAAAASPPRTASRTADLMRGILGDNGTRPEPIKQAKPAEDPFVAESIDEPREDDPVEATTRPTRRSTRVPRESLMKPAPAKPTALETLERTMPPELRSPGPNGKAARPKPPPVPGSARKTRAAVAAEAKEKETEREKREEARKKEAEARESAKDSLKEKAKAKEQENETEKEGSASGSHGHAEEAGKKSTEADREPATSQAQPATFDFTATAGKKDHTAPSTFAPSFTASTPPALAPVSANSGFSFTSSSTTRASSKEPSPAPSVSQRESAIPVPAASAKDLKAAALRIPSVSLPTFALLEIPFSFSNGMPDEDAKIKALKATVLEMPSRELQTFDLLA